MTTPGNNNHLAAVGALLEQTSAHRHVLKRVSLSEGSSLVQGLGIEPGSTLLLTGAFYGNVAPNSIDLTGK